MASFDAGTIHYTVEADTYSLLDSGERTDKTLDNLQRGMDRTDKKGRQLNTQMTALSKGVNQAAQNTNQASRALSTLTKTMGAVLSIGFAKRMLESADAYADQAHQIRVLSSSTEQYAQIQNRLLAIANSTNATLSDTTDRFINTSAAVERLGFTVLDNADALESLQAAFSANNVSQNQAQTVMRSYTNAVARGRLSVIGYTNLVKAMPQALDALAAATGETADTIHQLGIKGKISAEALVVALAASKDEMKALNDAAGNSLASAFNALSNNFRSFIGEVNEGANATSVLANTVTLLADNIDVVATALLSIGAGALAKYIAGLTASVVAHGRSVIAARAHAAEELKLAQAQVAATAAALRQAQATAASTGAHARATLAANNHAAAQARLQVAMAASAGGARTLLALLGGPVGIGIAVATAAAGFLTLGSNAKTSADDVGILATQLERLSSPELRLEQRKINEEIERLEEKARIAALRIETLNRRIEETGGRGSDVAQLRKEIEDLEAEIGGADRKADELRGTLEEISEILSGNKKTVSASVAGDVDEISEASKALQKLREDLHDVMLTERELAMVQAQRSLGADATEGEIQGARQLAAATYDLKKAKEAEAEAERKREKAASEAARASEADTKIIAQLAQEVGELNGVTLEMAQAKARAQLSPFATPEDVRAVNELTQAMHEYNQAQADREAVAQLDPMASERMQHEERLQMIDELHNRKVLTDDQYHQYKEQQERQRQQRMNEMAEEAFRQQSEWNNMLLDGVEAVGAEASTQIMGLMSGMTNATDAARALGRALVGSVVQALVQIGVEWVKQLIVGQAAQTAAAATAAATGATVAAAWAPAAAMASLATLGGNAAPASAGITATTGLAQGLAFAGGREFGGPVAADKLYRVNERGKPEIFNAADGNQYMLPNSRGEVVSNKKAMQQGGGTGVTVNVIEDASRGGEVSDTGDGVIDIFVADITGGGASSDAIAGAFGLRRRGR